MMPSPQDLVYFLEVARQGNVSRAATGLTVSQPTLSMSLKRLEECLGAELFVRFKTGVSLTPAGRKFVQEAQALVDQWERIRNVTAEEEQSLSGHFRIGLHVSVALYSLPKLLPALRTQMPDVEISWIHDLSRNVAQKILDNEVDLALVINPVQHPDLVIAHIAKDRVSFWKHPDLKDKDTLILDPDLLQSQDLLKRLKKSETFSFSRRMNSSSLEVIRTLTEEKIGVGILPERVAMMGSGKLVRVPKAPFFEDSLCLIYRAHQTRNRAFTELKRIFKETKI
ncbi:MAG: LysR family transcriptional regulator [Bdellovibrionota bacterium]